MLKRINSIAILAAARIPVQMDFLVVTAQGRRHRANFDTRKEANDALTDIKKRSTQEEFVASKLIPKFREVAEDWFRSKATPDFRRPSAVGDIAVVSILGGLHHQYVRI